MLRTLTAKVTVKRADTAQSPMQTNGSDGSWIIERGVRSLALALLVACAGALAADAPEIGQVSKDSVWVPTPERMIRRMLQLADTTPQDLVLDLGSGDGRIPIHAAKHFGARAVGVELEANLVALSRQRAKAEGVEHLVQFLQQDLFDADLSRATVIALYISPGVMTKLKPRFLALRPGTRIASHSFTLDDWEADEVVRVEGRTGYLWIVPAAVAGTWRVQVPGEDFTMRLEQKQQQLSATGERAGKVVHMLGEQLRGTEIRFSAFDRDGSVRYYQGTVDGSRMRGQSEGPGIVPLSWTAERSLKQ